MDVIDFKNGSNLKVFFKEKENYLIGQYKCYEEKGADSWFALTGYAWFSKTFGIVEEKKDSQDRIWGLLKAYQKNKDGWVALWPECVTKV